MKTHYTPTDAPYVHDADTLKIYKCTTCDATENTYQTSAYCLKCGHYMTLSSTVDANKVKEIKNRAYVPKEQTKKGRKEKFMDGLAGPGGGVVYPVKGSPVLRVQTNMDVEAHVRGTVLLTWGEHVVTTVNELGAAFAPFDTTSVMAKKADGTDIEIVQTACPPRTSKRVGRIEITGNESSYRAKKRQVTFRMGEQTAVFDLGALSTAVATAL